MSDQPIKVNCSHDSAGLGIVAILAFLMFVAAAGSNCVGPMRFYYSVDGQAHTFMLGKESAK